MTAKRHNTEGLANRIEEDARVTARVVALVNDGKSDAAVAAEVSAECGLTPPLSPSSITRWRKRHGELSPVAAAAECDDAPEPFFLAYAELHVATQGLARELLALSPSVVSKLPQRFYDAVVTTLLRAVDVKKLWAEPGGASAPSAPKKTTKARAAR